MSKIEKALNRARGESGSLQLVAVSGATALPAAVAAPVTVRPGHPETIARMAASETRLLGPGDLAARGIIHTGNLDDPAVQVFRELRTRIVQQCKGGNGVVLVTAVSKGSGSSFVALNLGAAFAFDKFKTSLVIDCNLKNPEMHRLLPDASLPGLTDYLENPSIEVGSIVHPVGIPRLRIIPAGTGSFTESEHFGATRMARLIREVRERHAERFIILDGPPMSDISDVRTLSELADYVLVVARYGRATNAQIEQCVNVFNERKLTGVVFNDQPRIPSRFRPPRAWRAARRRDPRGPNG